MSILAGILYAVMTSRPAVWLHLQWHHGRPCPRGVRRLQQLAHDEEWAKALMRAAMGR